MNADHKREAFEAAIAIEAGMPVEHFRSDRAGDTYASTGPKYAWWGWKASGGSAPGTETVSSVWLSQLRSEYLAFGENNQALKAKGEALQERLNTADQRVDELEAEVKALTAERDQLQIEVRALCKTVEYAGMRIKELDLLFGKYLLGMRAAVIEMEHGQGAESAMQWIINGLAGPGEFAPDDATDAQAYFDREIEAIDAGMAEVCAFHHPRPIAN